MSPSTTSAPIAIRIQIQAAMFLPPWSFRGKRRAPQFGSERFPVASLTGLVRTPRREDAAAHLAEGQTVRGPAAEDDLVAVLEEALAAEQLDHRPFGSRVGAGDGPGRHEV